MKNTNKHPDNLVALTPFKVRQASKKEKNILIVTIISGAPFPVPLK